jgi:3-hydroxyisobutyrate dehydrogenase-like beta-hydroxyacid dehydrogenase
MSWNRKHGPLVLRIVRPSYRLAVSARPPDAVGELVTEGASDAASLAGPIALSDPVGVNVTSDSDLRAAVLGADGLLTRMAPGTRLASAQHGASH